MLYLSPRIKRHLETSYYKPDIDATLFKVASEHRRISNSEFAPKDKRDLVRNSRTRAKGFAVVSNVWFVKYAEIRYKKNYKNPQTTKWAERCTSANKFKFKAMMQKADKRKQG